MNVHVVGAGKLGLAIIKALNESHTFKITSVISRTHKQNASLYSTYCSVSEAPLLDGVVFLCVPDDVIYEVANKLLATNKLAAGTIICHVSGARSSEELHNLKEAGFLVASFHPMQTFTYRNAIDAFEGVHISIESSSADAFETLLSLAQEMGATGNVIDAETKTNLHLAGVIISNFMAALFLIAGDVLQNSNPEQDANFVRHHFAKIASQTLENILLNGFPQAITGPASRGDLQTVQKHLHLLDNGNIASLYSILSDRLAQETLEENHPLRTFLKDTHP